MKSPSLPQGNSRVRVFYATWLLYAAYYFCRKDSGKLPELATGANGQLAGVEHTLILFGIAYSVAQWIAGCLADRLGGAAVACSGALISAFSTLLLSIGFAPPLGIVLELGNGFGQGFGWPGSLKLLGQAFPPVERPRVLAWWSGSYILGGYLATFLATYLALNSADPLRRNRSGGLLVPGAILLFVALGAAWFLRRSSKPGTVSPKPLAITRQLAVISAMYFLLKMMRYALLFWLPLYFSANLNYSPRSAQNTASFFTLFGLAGSLLTVWFSDRVLHGRRFRAAAVLLFSLGLLLVLHPVLCRSGPLGAVVSVSLMGMIIHGVDLLMSGVQVLDSVPPSHHGRAVGFVNAVGSFGQMLSAFVVTTMSYLYGWDWLFNLFVLCALLSAAICCLEWQSSQTKPLIPALT